MKKSEAVLFAAVLVDMLGFGIVMPVLPFYATALDATPLEVTLIIASFSAMQLVSSPLWGRVSDRRGRRPLLIAGLFASAVSYLIFGLADSVLVLLLSRMTAGAAGGTISVAQAYIADTTTHEERAHGLGLLGAASGLGVMMGPALGGFVSQWGGLAAPGFVAAGLCTLNGLAAVAFLPESRARASMRARGEAASLAGWFHTMTRYPLSLLLGVYFLTISAFTAMSALLALYAEARFGLQADDVGLLFALAGATTVIVRGVLLGRLVRRFGEPFTVRVGAIGLLCALAAMPLAPSAAWLWGVVPLYAFGAGTLFPALASLVSRATDDASQGSVLGGSQVVGGMGRVIGPVWAGWVFQSIGIDTPFVVAAVIVAIAWLLALRIPAARRTAPAAPIAATEEVVGRRGVGTD
jgi:MFS family permease